jgi:hypothetical protein
LQPIVKNGKLELMGRSMSTDNSRRSGMNCVSSILWHVSILNKVMKLVSRNMCCQFDTYYSFILKMIYGDGIVKVIVFS